MSQQVRKKRVTLHDVAAAADVSIATVSYVLNNQGSVSEDVRKTVRRTAKKLGYQQNRAARAMKMGRSNIIGLVIPNIENPFFATVAQSVLAESQKRGYQVFLVDTEGSHESEAKAVQGLAAQGVDGVIVFPVDDSELTTSNRTLVPVVVLDRDTPDLDLVQAEYYEGGRLLAEHLVSLGHKRFAILEGPRVVSSVRSRTQGFAESLNNDSRIVWQIEHPFVMQLTEDARQRLQEPGFSALVCGNDLIAMAAIAYFRDSEIAVPNEVSVVGFDDIPFASVVTPSLTTIQMPIANMGKEAVNLLIRRLQEKEERRGRSRVVLDVELVIRESTAPPE